jgi:hypothetical protein
MKMKPGSNYHGRHGIRTQTWAPSVAGLAAGAVVPAIVAVALLVSVALHRPLLARAARQRRDFSAVRLTIAWGLVMAVIAAAQGAGAILGIASIATTAGLVARTGFALAVEAVAILATAMYVMTLSRPLGPGEQASDGPSLATEHGGGH